MPKKTTKLTFPQRVAHNTIRLRNKAKLSVAVAAKKSKIDPQVWYRIETGKHCGVAGCKLDALAEFFKVGISTMVAMPRKGKDVSSRKENRGKD